MSKFSATEKRKCAEREVALRKAVYPKYRKMTPEQCQREIDMMIEIADDYKKWEKVNPLHSPASPHLSDEHDPSLPSDNPALAVTFGKYQGS